MYNAMRITRTEAHRISQQAAYDALKKAKDNGAYVVKQWDATLDKRTRPSHARVDGEIRELDEPFSKGLMRPGDPRGRAAEVINCRCQLLQRAKRALDGDELDELKDRAAYFGLDKTADFEEFRRKYMPASIANSENSGTIKEQSIYAVSTDRAQFERYRNVLKKDAPKTFEDFLQIKYTDSDKWNKIKALVNSKNYLQEQLAYIYNGEKCFIPKHTVFSSKAKVIAGGAAKNKIRCVDSLIKKYGGTAEKWEKKVASIKSDKYLFDVHWYECDGIQYEMKLKHRKEL